MSSPGCLTWGTGVTQELVSITETRRVRGSREGLRSEKAQGGVSEVSNCGVVTGGLDQPVGPAG